MRIEFKVNKRRMVITEQVRFYDDNFFSHVRIGMLIRRNLNKPVVFANAALGTEHIVVKIKPNEIIVNIPAMSNFEYEPEGALTTMSQIADIEQHTSYNSNDVFSPEEYLELGLFTCLPN